MSWMDSWSRPGKRSAIPPPYYLTSNEEVPYCHTCGRVINSRKSNQKANAAVKYCSDRCRNHRPGPVDRRIEQAIVSLLKGQDPEQQSSTTGESGADDKSKPQSKQAKKKKTPKGDPRILVSCDEIEVAVFGKREEPGRGANGRRKTKKGAHEGDDQWKSIDMVSESESDSSDAEADDEDGGAVVGKKSSSEQAEGSSTELEKRAQGQRRAEEREMVRRAARRGVVFGFVVSSDDPSPAPAGVADQVSQDRRKGQKNSSDKNENAGAAPQPVRQKCEAVMKGQVVEPSFAKGNWAIRWRD